MNDTQRDYFEHTDERMPPGYVYPTDAEARAALGVEDAPPMFEGLWREINAKRARFRANAAQVTEWEQARPGCMGTLCDECGMSPEDCNEYQDWIHSEDNRVRPTTTAQAMEITGAFTPRCD